MKYLIVLLVVLLGVWLLLRGRSKPNPPAKPTDAGRRNADLAAPMQMVACTRCGVHLPQQEALPDGQGRLFCGIEHRDAGPG